MEHHFPQHSLQKTSQSHSGQACLTFRKGTTKALREVGLADKTKAKSRKTIRAALTKVRLPMDHEEILKGMFPNGAPFSATLVAKNIAVS